MTDGGVPEFRVRLRLRGRELVGMSMLMPCICLRDGMVETEVGISGMMSSPCSHVTMARDTS